MDYAAALRQAHIDSLRQRYLDIMEEARVDKDRQLEDYGEDARDAYIDYMESKRDRPQQLRAAGLSGGAEDVDMDELVFAYRDQLADLKKQRKRFLEEYDRIISKQTQAMNNAINEYNLRMAKQDTKKSGSGSSSSKGVPQIKGGRADVEGLLETVVANRETTSETKLNKHTRPR